LTEASAAEQESAGLHQCGKVQFEKFEALNDAYKQKFGFPFVMAVRGSSCDEILEAFSRRLQNDKDVEFETALVEIHKIARLRLEAMDKAR
jgi:2-oxo-4-hydroxy-4-carboxy-5-ureidoimidazoline decarboxylase